MGKYIIIKNVDFSTNAIEQIDLDRIYLYGFTDSQFNSFNLNINMSAATFVDEPQTSFSGIPIKGIRAKVTQTGTLSIYKLTNGMPTNSSQYSSSNVVLIETLNITSTGIQDISFTNPVTLGPNEYIGIGKTTDTAQVGYGTLSGHNIYLYVGASRNVAKSSGYTLGIDYFV